uniref:Uncharacterized protein n=1 Tax=Meloidogyne incognita TaxID=6306 RepID=A0A914LUU9_MELIC
MRRPKKRFLFCSKSVIAPSVIINSTQYLHPFSGKEAALLAAKRIVGVKSDGQP